MGSINLELIHTFDQTADGDMLRLTIRNKYNSLSRAARQIADFLLEHQDQAVYMNITMLAEQVGVSEATITKFARTIGCSSFAELKIALARGGNRPEGVEEGILASSIDAMQRVFLENIKLLQDTLTLLDVDKMYDVGRKILHARKTDIYGMGTTSCVANYLYTRLNNLGIVANYHCDPYQQRASAALLTKKDVAVGISVTGQSEEIANALSIARNSGAATIGITGNDHSPVAQAADIVLFTASTQQENYNSGTRIAEFSMADALIEATGTLLKHKEND